MNNTKPLLFVSNIICQKDKRIISNEYGYIDKNSHEKLINIIKLNNNGYYIICDFIIKNEKLNNEYYQGLPVKIDKNKLFFKQEKILTFLDLKRIKEILIVSINNSWRNTQAAEGSCFESK